MFPLRCIIVSQVFNSAPKSVSMILRAAKTIILQSCGVENASEDTIVMAAKEKSSISATYCDGSDSNTTNCRYQTGMPGINMHYFSKDETLPKKWIRFVRIHRKDFLAVKKPALCCAHFDDIAVLIWWGWKSEERVESLLVARRLSAMFIKRVRYIIS